MAPTRTAAAAAAPPPPAPAVPPFRVCRSELIALNDAKDTTALQQRYGGAEGLAASLCSDLQRGISTTTTTTTTTSIASSSSTASGTPAATGDGLRDRSGGGGGAAVTVAERAEVFGSNEMPTVPLKSLFALIWDNLQDPILLLLIAAALVGRGSGLGQQMPVEGVSTVLGAAIPEQRHESGWVEGVAIWVAIAVVVLVSSFNDYSKDRQFAALNRQRDLTDVTVLRDGVEARIRNTELVVGDVLVLSAGDKVAADGVLAVPGRDRGGLLAVDESSLTGESDAVKKTLTDDPWVRCGTQVQEGGGRILVLTVGADTEYGKTMAIVGTAGGEDTPLMEKLGDLAGAIGKIGAVAAVILFIVLLVKWMIENRGFPIKKINDDGPVQFFLYCVTIVVVAVPEGLPLAVTISLAYSMRQMMDDQCFVRVLEACETMGGCTAICSDKTGTLTQNRMTVVEGWLAPGTKLDRAPLASELPAPLLDDLQRNIALNSKAFLIDPAERPGHSPGHGKAHTGHTRGRHGKSVPAARPAAAAAAAPEPYGVAIAGGGGSDMGADVELGNVRQQSNGAAAAAAAAAAVAAGKETAEPAGMRRAEAASPGGLGGPGWLVRPCLALGRRCALLEAGREVSVADSAAADGDAAAAAVATPAGGVAPPPRIQFVGNRTECALLVLMEYGWGVRRYGDVRREYEASLERVYAFTSERKMSSAVLRMPGGSLRLYNKGAAEWVLRACTAVQAADGTSAVPLDERRRAELEGLVDEMAGRGLRCIALAVRDLDPEPSGGWPEGYWEEAPAEDMVLQALFAIKDPVRPEVPAAVATCQRAGITVRMVTGDNVSTARFIARECAILTPGGLALEGPAFRQLSDEQLAELLPRLQVLARSSPADKFRLVCALKAQREVVAVTGDGTNDAPALKESDVGLAMGITGTEVAKEAADIVILDDNFSSIVKAVLWGRTVFENIRKFVAFQLTVNIVALVVAFVGAIAGGREPLTVLQLLWVNLIMDTLAALALSTERPDPEILSRKPYGRHEHLITPTMLRYMLSQAAYQIAVLFFMLYALPDVLPGRYGTAVDPDHVFNEINSRRISDELNVFARLHRSPIFVGVLAGTVGAQIIIVELLGSFFDVEPLAWYEWLVSIALGAVSLPLSTLVRLLGRAARARSERRERVAAAARFGAVEVEAELSGSAPAAQDAGAATAGPPAGPVELLPAGQRGAKAREAAPPAAGKQ
ncbi:hypothetical protein GPECTOR_3g484 [Gonium pectorale]|uniref:Calcium-transporting ATPase n=1 Tax=Gonium pectorale TaxID=33097 RepID=A0A150GZZ5_GONPE|nr:hypothetical protein GPECTOR_3g484 [Gonium pectorale]|eukprot:KXZ55354.1 hypothetical protein GPECTOR_3g484 [Gonium pectorale]